MFFYTLQLIEFWVMEKIGKKIRINGVPIYIFPIFAILLLLFSFRSITVGFDTYAYIDEFYKIDTHGILRYYLEPGWQLLNKAVYFLMPSHEIMYLVVGAIALLCFLGVAHKLSKNEACSIFVYYMLGFYFNLMNQTRNALAYSICMVSFYFLYKKKILKSICVAVVACMFHKSAIIFVGFILLDVLIKNRAKYVYGIMGVVAVVFFMNYDTIFSFVTRYYYKAYAETSRLHHVDGGNLKFFFAYTIILLMCAYFDRLRDRSETDVSSEDARLRELLFLVTGFGVALELLSLKNNMIQRFAHYFEIYFTLLIPNTLYNLRKGATSKYYKIICYTLLLAFMVIYLSFSENGLGKDGVVPYSFAFLD